MMITSLFSFAGLFSIIASELVILTRQSPPMNVSVDLNTNKDIYASNFGVSKSKDFNNLVHTSAISDADYQKAVCRGQKLFLAMTKDSSQGTRYINPLNSPWDGDLEEEGLNWAWNLWENEDSWCEFHEDGLATALGALSISGKSITEGGENTCYSAFHYDSPIVLFDPADPFYLDDEENRMLPKDKQYYLDPKGDRQRVRQCTGSTYTFGVNARSGVLYFVSRKSPLESAKELWKRTPLTSELPELRMSSDFAWGIWNKIRGPFYRTEIRKIMTLYIVNPETIDILRRALAKHDVSEIKRWPGTEIDPKTEEGLAILGSANGRAVGYFLAQHKTQLGRDKYVSKMTVFRSDSTEKVLPIVLFWVDNVPTPPPEMAEPKPDEEEEDKKPEKGVERVDSTLVGRSSNGRNVLKEHVLWA